ncbi:MAG: DUF2837 family protein [Peptococcaceae bacterium]|nr:DUF2837 family protein [Candidatus Syntrophopropionicum ammoniitolerans]
MERLLIVAALTAVIHFINTLAYAMRISGVRTQRLATGLSIYNVIFLVASTANTIQAPILASIVEMVIKTGQIQTGIRVADAELVNSAAYQALLVSLGDNIRFVILAATVGTVIAAALIPVFVNIFNRAIFSFEETGSVPRMLAGIIISPRRFMRAGGQIGQQSRKSFKITPKRKVAIPKTFLFLNIIVTGVYTTGVLSAIYAGALFPNFRSTAALLSAVVNGVATILAATVVEPTAAAITDQALQGERSDEDVKQMVIYLSLTRILGTALAQLIFVPAAYLVKYAASLLV